MPSPLPGLADYGLDGRAALAAVIAASPYGSAPQAVASLTLFSHPATVAQIPGGALFPCVRSLGRADRRTIVERNGRKLGLDDNAAAHATFAGCNLLKAAGRDTQLNHIYARRDDPGAFTALANLCMGPSFLAKLSDHDPEIVALLQWRAFDLYGWRPDGLSPPEKPVSYHRLVWAATLPATPDVEAAVRARLVKRPRDFTTEMTGIIGWAFSGFEPDPAFRASSLPSGAGAA